MSIENVDDWNETDVPAYIKANVQPHIAVAHITPHRLARNLSFGDHMLTFKQIGKGDGTGGPQAAMQAWSILSAMPFQLCSTIHRNNSGSRMSQSRMFIAFQTIRDIAYYLDYYNSKGRPASVTELIRDDCHARFYIDFDLKLTRPPDDGVINDILNVIVDTTREQLIENKVPDDLIDNIHVKSRCGMIADKFKVSFHIIHSSVLFKTNWNKVHGMRAFMNKIACICRPLIHDIIKPYLPDGALFPNDAFDDKVYTRNRMLNMVKTIKPYTVIGGHTTQLVMNIHAGSHTHDKPTEEMLLSTLVSIPVGRETLDSFHIMPEIVCEGNTIVTHPAASSLIHGRIRGVLTGSHRFPRSEEGLARRWIGEYYRLKRCTYPDIPEVFVCSSMKAGDQPWILFATSNHDNVCEMKGRMHVGDEKGLMIGYLVNMIKMTVTPTCHSCGQGPSVVIGNRHDESLRELLLFGSGSDVADLIQKEFCDGASVRVDPGFNAKDGIFVWDEQHPGNGIYNDYVGNTKLWKEGGVFHLRTKIVVPWLNRKFHLLKLYAKHIGNAKLLTGIMKERRKQLSLGATESLAKNVCQYMSQHAHDDGVFDSFGSSTDVYESFMIATNDGMVVDLETGQKIPRLPSHRFTMHANFSLLDLTTQPNKDLLAAVNEYVLENATNDLAKAAYLQEIFGISITCCHDARQIWMHIGCGANGKTTTDKIISHAMGNFHACVRSDFLTQRSNFTKNASSATPELMRLLKCRSITQNEVDPNSHLASALTKVLADGSPMSGRALYKDEQEIRVYGKVHVMTNDCLIMDAQDIAIRDRVTIIKWNNRYVPNPIGPNEQKSSPQKTAYLLENPNAVGTWLVHGAMRAISHLGTTGSIPRPATIEAETQAEFTKIDTMGGFFGSKAIFHPAIRTGVPLIGATQMAWSWLKQECFDVFRDYLSSTSSTQKFELQSFNGMYIIYYCMR